MLRGTKLDPPLINALVESWRPLPCGECTITLEDVSLQLDLSVDGDITTGPIISVNCSATCEQLLEKVSNKFRGSLIEMRWLRTTFKLSRLLRVTLKRNNLNAFILRLPIYVRLMNWCAPRSALFCKNLEFACYRFLSLYSYMLPGRKKLLS